MATSGLCKVCGERAKLVRKMCPKHYARWRRHGDPTVSLRDQSTRAPTGLTETERFHHHVEVDLATGCWNWQGYLQRGYGRFLYDDGTTDPAHRAAWKLLVGPIPEELTVDHLCRNRACVVPEHLELVTMAENIRRGAAHWRETTATCKAGLHSYPENRMVETSTGRTRCRECKREAQRRYKANRRR